MGRKVDAQILKLEQKTKFITGRLEEFINAQYEIIKVHNDTMIQMRDLLTKLIEGR